MKQALEGFAREEMGHKARLEAIRADTDFKPRFGQVMDLKIADYLGGVSPDADLDYRENRDAHHFGRKMVSVPIFHWCYAAVWR